MAKSKIKIPIISSYELKSLKDIFKIPENWELCAWPISYDGTVSFIFKNIEEGDVADETEGADSKTYHFKIVTAENFDFKKVNCSDMEFEGLALISIYRYEGGFVAFVRNATGEVAAMYFDKKEHSTDIIPLGIYATRVGVTKDGRIYVGYEYVDGENFPSFSVIAPTGEHIYDCFDNSARLCKDMVIDSDDNIWASCAPTSELFRVSKDNIVEQLPSKIAGSASIAIVRLKNRYGLIYLFDNSDLWRPANYLSFNNEIFEIQFKGIDPGNITSGSISSDYAILATSDDKIHFINLKAIEDKV